MFTRRKFVLSTAATSLLPTVALAKAGAKTRVAATSADVVIIGGGLSGMNSALLLRDLGYKVVVLEAGEKVGGRVKAVETVDGSIDVGASQIGRGYARVLDACQRFGLELMPEDRDLLTFGAHFMDSWIDPKTWESNPLNKTVGDERRIAPMLMGQQITAKYNPCHEVDDWLNPNLAEYDISLRELMRRKGHSEAAITLAASSAPGIGIDETSMLRMWQEDTRGAIDRKLGLPNETHQRNHPFGEANDHKSVNGLSSINNIVGGCTRLPMAMGNALGDIIRVGKRVGRIEMSDRSAMITCLDGSTFKARFVISAIPFTMLRDVEIVGKPNPIARQAITQMPYANTARMYLTIERPFWQEDGLPPSFSTDGPLGMFWAIDNHTGTGAHRAMIVLVGKAGQAISAMERPQAEAFVLEELGRLRPASRGLTRMATYKDWMRDPLQKGCGFSFAPGQVNAFGRDMTKPWQVMHFAGEHTRRVDFGMESAFESGERAAIEISSRG